MSAASQRERKKKAAKKRADNAKTKPAAKTPDKPKAAPKSERPTLSPGLYDMIETERLDLIIAHLNKQPHEDVDHILNWRTRDHVIPIVRVDAAKFFGQIKDAQDKHDSENTKNPAPDDPPATT